MYAVLDIETTGGKFNEEGITEIAIHRFDGHEVTDTFISLINPERSIQPYVQKLTGINEKMLRTAPKFHEVAKRIVEITEGSTLVAHNAQFDYRILRTEFRRLGYDFQRKSLCTVDLAKRLIPDAESHSLGKLVRSLGIAVNNRHRANGDALATLKLFQVLLQKDTSKSIVAEIMRSASAGELSNRQLELVESVPTDTGVYYLFNKKGEIIYLSSSTNMKQQINSHFTGSGKDSLQLRKETRQVSFEKTGSELYARLKAHIELLQNKPVFGPKPVSLKVPGKEIVVNGKPYPLKNADLLLIDKGRDTGEKAAIWLQESRVKGMGFFGLNHQINNIHILESLLTPVEFTPGCTGIVHEYLRNKSVLKVLEL